MYIIERLRRDYPQHMEDIDRFDTFLKNHFKNIEKIATDDKDNYRFVDAAYRSKPAEGEPVNVEYLKNMALYEFSFNYDRDFLLEFMPDATDDMTVDDIRRRLLGKDYDEAQERINKEKLR